MVADAGQNAVALNDLGIGSNGLDQEGWLRPNDCCGKSLNSVGIADRRELRCALQPVVQLGRRPGRRRGGDFVANGETKRVVCSEVHHAFGGGKMIRLSVKRYSR